MTDSAKKTLILSGIMLGGLLLVGTVWTVADPCAQMKRAYLKQRSMGLRPTEVVVQARREGCDWVRGVA